MNYSITETDKVQWNALHGKKSEQGMAVSSKLLRQELEKCVDSCYQGIERVKTDIAKFQNWCESGNYSQSIVKEMKNAIDKATSYIQITEMLGNYYLIQMDVNTYSNLVIVADGEWEWRAYARHFFTILYEHKDSVFRFLNKFMNQSKESFGENSDEYCQLKNERKRFVSIINSNSDFAKDIRVTADAHYDEKTSFIERKSLIESMSYAEVISLINDYLVQSTLLIKSLQSLIGNNENTLNLALNSVVNEMQKYLKDLEPAKKQP